MPLVAQLLSRLVIAGISGGSGKTLLSLGLSRALTRRGCRVKPFKKGPDYIDAAWLALAAGGPATNLDPFFLDGERLAALCLDSAGEAELALIEGNRGLYDGRDVAGSCSTAALARMLDAPVILTLNCTKMTRTAAALVAGLAAFEPLRLGGVVLNQIGTQRHAALVRAAIETHTDIPVLGALPRLKVNPLPERHMGLAGGQATSPAVESALNQLADLVESETDVEAMHALANSAPPLTANLPFWGETLAPDFAPCIGVVRDEAIWFYYEENLEALRRAGAILRPLSLFDEQPWSNQPLHGIYLGGGFPESHAERLSASPRLGELKQLSESGLPIYAECGGFMLLCASLHIDGTAYPMSGVFPVETGVTPKPQGLGYIEAEVVAENPFHPLGARLRGHEFHYSRCLHLAPDLPCALRLSPGVGMGKGRDGLLLRRTFAAYTHLFAPAVPHWAPAFVAACGTFFRDQTQA